MYKNDLIEELNGPMKTHSTWKIQKMILEQTKIIYVQILKMLQMKEIIIFTTLSARSGYDTRSFF